LAGRIRQVTGPPPAVVNLWPTAHLTHPESEESGEEEGQEAEGQRDEGGGEEGEEVVEAPSGPVMAPPRVVPPAMSPTVPTTLTVHASAPPVIPTPTVAPTLVAKAPPTVPVTQPAPGTVSTTTGAQVPRDRPPATDEQHPKRVATEAAASQRSAQLAAGGGPPPPSGPAAGTESSGEAQADQRWEEAKAEVQRRWNLSQDLQTAARAAGGYTAFKESAEMAQDALQAAKEASRQAREARIAAVGALPLTGLQVPGAPSVVEPSEQFEADCREGVQALTEEILKRGSAVAAAARRAARKAQRQGEETRGAASQASTHSGTMPPPPPAHNDDGAGHACRTATHQRDWRDRAWASSGRQVRATPAARLGATSKARTPSPCGKARREGGVQCSNEPLGHPQHPQPAAP
jgi:hypothetical protein